MQKTILLFLCLFSFAGSYAQTLYPEVWFCSFEHPHDTIGTHLVIDTVHYKHNVWQIGAPHKTVFSTAFRPPNVIITDTVNDCKVNDTSVFIVKQAILTTGILEGAPAIRFSYKLNIDSGDKALVDISYDKGQHWKNVSNDSVNPLFLDFRGPRYDTSVTNWTYGGFVALDSPLSHIDSVFYRFTFITDSVDSHEEGWMIDDIVLDADHGDFVVPVAVGDNFISIYPNPCTNELYIKSRAVAAHTPQVSIYDALGRQLYNAALTTDHIPINLPNGTYMLRYTTDDVVAQKMFVVHR